MGSGKVACCVRKVRALIANVTAMCDVGGEEANEALVWVVGQFPLKFQRS